MVKIVPQADAKSASMGWFFDPGFIQKVQRIAADVENPSMESIDSVLFALREMGYIKTAPTCEHGFSVNECVSGMCELQTENDALRSRVARLEEAGRNILCKIPETKNDYSGVGYCFGCGVVKWASGQGSYSEECKPDCALQEFRRALEEK